MGSREFWFEDLRELRWHVLSREAIYGVMIRDLGTSGKPEKLAKGIWEIGRKRLPGRDASKVIFVESGVPESALEMAIARDPFKALCLLSEGSPPKYSWHSEKTIVGGTIEVREGRFTSDVFEDLSASQHESSAETRVDLEEHPPRLWICGEEFTLAEDRGRPTLGVLYLAHLFENPRSPITCWDIERMANPRLKELASIPLGSDPRMSKKAQRDLDESIKKALAILAEAKNAPCAAQLEIDAARAELNRLLEQKQVDTGKGGKSRLLGDPEQEKARRRVRKALNAIVVIVAAQNPVTGESLREAVGEGAEIYFNPPPDWGL